jgi:hypothetical protein
VISPSSYKLYRRCPRAWWYRYVAGRRRAGTAALALGTAVHEVAESVLRGDAGAVERAPPEVRGRLRPSALGVLETLRATPGGLIEVAIDRALPGCEDRLGGRCDWTHPTGGANSVPLIVDHKTTKDPQYWGTPDTLAADSQLLAYAWALYPDWGGPIVVAHLYLPPAPLEAALVSAVATPEARDATARAYASVARIVQGLRQIVDADAVPATPGGACKQFGGCDHAAICAACPAWAKPRAPRPPSPPPEAVVVTPAQRKLQNEARVRCGLAPLPDVTEAPQGLQDASNGAPPTQETPGAPRPPRTPAPPAERARPDPGARALPTLPPDPEETGDEPTEIRVAPVVDAPAPKAPKAPAAAPKAPAAAPKAPKAPKAPLVLVGCVASTGEGATIEAWAGEYLAEAASGAGASSYLLVEYGRGPLLATALIAAAVKRGDLALPPVLTIPARHPLAATLPPTLRVLGAVIVVGVSS